MMRTRSKESRGKKKEGKVQLARKHSGRERSLPEYIVGGSGQRIVSVLKYFEIKY